MYYIHKFFGDLGVKTEMPEEIIQVLDQTFSSFEDDLKPAEVEVKDANEVHPIRDSKVNWVPHTHWISATISSYVTGVNRDFFKFDLIDWIGPLQYTVYTGGQSYYDWHVDHFPGTESQPEAIRKLTVVLGLSDAEDYEGGELEYFYGKTRFSSRIGKGELHIFPATLPHRVRKVTSGTRKTLVGWYGGPPFK